MVIAISCGNNKKCLIECFELQKISENRVEGEIYEKFFAVYTYKSKWFVRGKILSERNFFSSEMKEIK